ncbi:2-hydroxyacid dehydrogenase [Intrasporangium calvum]|uniref:D-isomer specific 2-hydroxyacid dehydrogenase NAD-binding protein n=1 Tax=Intrasporangium calvum (strain ATCC 23552 / DSM 43043 / JCM 3097 / NBRC 12989 / NCIMB 10167 / NRRL B-3866 / 7 KIP) TaxID=710696 RepID=E6SFU7_INTC7|nr:2-hydroxyacid dehydrogenase [Intrasporangium calvum]ADU48876.1 D-isomer specific 2-hydroxyacid dehydrogenase NAD-binding protein [Intrasporangium calvum DSM 43043]AXG13857.1 hydroxyacid dehydrogenase [Intrasporangium calvum]
MSAVRPVVVSVPEESYAAGLASVEGVEPVLWDLSGPHPRGVEIRLVVPPYMGAPPARERLEELPRLEVVQLLTAGYESVLGAIPEGVSLCNGAGIHDASTAELALALVLASCRDLPHHVRAQDRGEWAGPRIWGALADRRVLVVGYGQIGRAIVRRLLPFEVDVTVVASRARPGDDLVDAVHGMDELPRLAAHADVLILIVPLNDGTRGLVGADLLARLPDGGLVVNVARGGVVDTDALVAECASGRLRAALDVTDPEPLPQDHPLWRTPGVLITPHVGGATAAMAPRALALLRRQVEALRDDRPLDNLVNAAPRP